MSQKPRTFVVTGASGLIGSALVPLLSQEALLCCLGRREPRVAQAVRESMSFIYADLSQGLPWHGLPTQADGVIHLAGTVGAITDPAHWLEAYLLNVAATSRLLEYGRRAGIRTFVYASSGAVYGYRPEAAKEDDPLSPLGFYGMTKAHAEQLIRCYEGLFSTVVLRYFFPYGPGQSEERLVPSLVAKVQRGEPVAVYNGGSHPRINPIYATDAAAVILRALRLTGQHVVNVGGEEVVTLQELVERIAAAVGKAPQYASVEDPSISNLMADTARLKTLLDFVPRVPLDEGIQMVATCPKAMVRQ